MTLRRIFKECLKHPKRKFKSQQASMYEQTVQTIMYWFYSDIIPTKDSTRHYKKAITATDWEFEKK